MAHLIMLNWVEIRLYTHNTGIRACVSVYIKATRDRPSAGI